MLALEEGRPLGAPHAGFDATEYLIQIGIA
jgi:hypothetical protein